MTLFVLGGGNSPEREVSLRSANNIATAAKQAGFDVEQIDPAVGSEFLDRIKPDSIVLPILHGAGGEDGSIQAELEKRQIPFLGSGSRVSGDCWDKWRCLQKLANSHIPIAQSELVTTNTLAKSELLSRPYVLKVRRGGSSIGVLIVREPDKAKIWQIETVFAMESPAILEELVVGTEITIAVLDNKALPVVEIRPPLGEEFDYENKYNGQSAEICPPESVSEQIQQNAQKLAEAAHQTMGCRHLSRIDMMVRPNGELVVFDINTMPGLTEQSLFPKAAAAADIGMPELVKIFVALVKRDRNSTTNKEVGERRP